ncbi:N-acetyltransferase family protein [Stetteria hydrogenophila]
MEWDLDSAVEVVGRCLGRVHAYYAREAAVGAGGFGLVAREGSRVAGAVVAYPARGPVCLGVIYYVAVLEGWRGRGLGRVLVASAEEALEWEGCRFTVATTSRGNEASVRLFSSLGYRVLGVEEAAGELGWEAVDALLHASCSFEDDVLMVKPWDPSTLSKLAPDDYRETWWRACYKPWLRLWRRGLRG